MADPVPVETPPSISKSALLWDQLNAIPIQGLITLILLGIWYFSSIRSGIDDIKNHWDQYRCSPLIMPFASLYGHNTAENFNGCMKDLFGGFTGEITSPFTSILTMFTEVLGSLMEAVNSIRVAGSTMGGGINVIFQEFTDRIRNFFFEVRMSAIRIKTLIGRMYAVMFSVMYMGLSGISAAQNFGDTTLFSFLDTFCFPPETQIQVVNKGLIDIQNVRIGDVLLPTNSIVTAKFHFSAKGQPMVQLPGMNGKRPVQVSTNHYIWHNNRWIMAKDHPFAESIGAYARHSLICLNTSDHCIPISGYLFCDYDETSEGDEKTMAMIEERVNASPPVHGVSPVHENSPSFHPLTPIRLLDGSYRPVHLLTTDMVLSTGSRITGILHKKISEYCYVSPTVSIGSATLVWDPAEEKWKRAHTLYSTHTFLNPYVYIGLIVTPTSQIEVQDNLFVRDYMELCSPDAEAFYTTALQGTA